MKNLLFALSLMSAHAALASVIDLENNPDAMRIGGESAYERNFAALPTSGAATNQGWSDDYYAVVHRGICAMFKGDFDPSKEVQSEGESEAQFSARKERLSAVAKKKDALLQISESDLAKMSAFNLGRLPAPMILDIKNKNFSYPLTAAELKRTKSVGDQYDALDIRRKDAEKRYQDAARAGNKSVADKARQEYEAIMKDINKINWFGQCHGWAPATVNEVEPQACTTKLVAAGKELLVPVWSSDMKALTAHLMAHYVGNENESGFCGRRCNTYYEDGEVKKLSDTTFTDINPGALHIILANKLGKLKKGFVLEVTADAPVWNQGVVSFKVLSQAEQSAAQIEALVAQGKVKDLSVAPGTAKQILVESEAKYIVEVHPHQQAQNGRGNFYKTARYKYLLELDASGKILGGRYVDGSVDEHPDFVWDKGKMDPNSRLARPYFGQGMIQLMKESKMLPDEEADRVARERAEAEAAAAAAAAEAARIERERVAAEAAAAAAAAAAEEAARIERERIERERIEREGSGGETPVVVAPDLSTLLSVAEPAMMSLMRKERQVFELSRSEKESILKLALSSPEQMRKLKAISSSTRQVRVQARRGIAKFIDWDQQSGRCVAFEVSGERFARDFQCHSSPESRFFKEPRSRTCQEYIHVMEGRHGRRQVIREVPMSVCSRFAAGASGFERRHGHDRDRDDDDEDDGTI